LQEIGNGAPRVINTMPHNYLNLGLIATLFPQARIIHCRRNPVDTCVECYFQNFNKIPYATSWRHLALYYRQYQRLMQHWQKTLPVAIHEVQLEKLLANPEQETQKLAEYCGLEWSPRLIDFHRERSTTRHISQQEVRRPLAPFASWPRDRYREHLRS
jgi:hypothetical protein